MANTHTELSIHAVFAVQYRENLILPSWRDNLHRYIAGILHECTGYSLAVGGWKDHVHIAFELKPDGAVADVLRVVKSNSSKWINESKFVRGKFSWQTGYGAFAFGREGRDGIINYIRTQEAHHQTATFREEYDRLLGPLEERKKQYCMFDFYE